MKLASLGLVTLLAACGGNGPDGEFNPAPTPDAPGGGGSGTSVAWTLRRGGTIITCASFNASDIFVTADPEEGSTITKMYPCVLTPVMISLPAGRWAIKATLHGDDIVEAPAKAVTVPASAPVAFDFYVP